MRANFITASEISHMIKKTLLTLPIIALLSGSVSAIDPQAEASSARAIAKQLGMSLKGALVPAMKSGGPIKAVGICNTQSPVIGHAVTEANQPWQVGRTSLKVRNTDNRPDTWESAVLQRFEQRKAAGESAKQMEFAEVVERDGKKTFRYMKAIPTGEACLHCHGKEVKEPVKTALRGLYPDDQAYGFKLGDIRGAFTLQKEL